MKDKILNFLLIFLTVFVVLSFFDNWAKKQEQTWNILISSLSEKYTIPASVKISIKNNSSNDLSINTCDLKIKSIVWNIDLADKSFCHNIIVKSQKSEIVDYSKYYNKFSEAWDYFVETKIDSKDYMAKFSIENKWFFNKFFTFFFYAPFYNLVAFILTITSYSLFWAIVLVTIIIRSILLYPQHKMMISQARMQAIQPKIKEIQEKYKWNHQMLWVELMKLYKDEKVNPVWSCLPLLIQMPILIVVYHILISIQDPVNFYYIYSFLQNFSISAIQTKFYFLDLLSVWWIIGWILALLVWIIQFIQIKLSLSYQNNNKDNKNIVLEKKKWEDNYDVSSFMPDTQILNKFMLYGMPVMVAIFTYTFYLWVGIYWGISTLFMIFQQLFVNKIIKKSSK